MSEPSGLNFASDRMRQHASSAPPTLPRGSDPRCMQPGRHPGRDNARPIWAEMRLHYRARVPQRSSGPLRVERVPHPAIRIIHRALVSRREPSGLNSTSPDSESPHDSTRRQWAAPNQPPTIARLCCRSPIVTTREPSRLKLATCTCPCVRCQFTHLPAGGGLPHARCPYQMLRDYDARASRR